MSTTQLAPITIVAEPVSDSRTAELAKTAEGLAAEVAGFHPHSPEFIHRLEDVRTLASKEIVATSNSGSHLLDRTVAQSNRSGGDATKRVAGSLSDLRNVVSDLVPGGTGKNPFQKFIARLPGARGVGRFLQKYESYQAHLNAIVKSLEAGKDELIRDNGALLAEQQELRANIGKLQEFIVFADQLDVAVSSEVAKLRSEGNELSASAMEQEVLYEVRQKARNLRVQMAAADQGYLAMDTLRKNNIELVKGVENTQTVTVSAMRTAIMVASALETQAQVAEQNQKTRDATEAMIVRNAALLRQSGAAIQEQTAAAPVSVEALAEAFGHISAAINDVETFRSSAVLEMKSSIAQLDAQLDAARPFVERAAAVEAVQERTRPALAP